MFYLINDQIPLTTFDQEIHRLQQLLQDLEKIRTGRHAGRKQLAHAPVINDWRIVGRPKPCLVGNVTGHPHVKNGHTAITTSLWLFAPMFGFARTLSRYYVVRRPASDNVSFH